MQYLSYNKKTIVDISDTSVESEYNRGFVMTRVGKGVMNETSSLRINLSNFDLTSENRRILRKTENLALSKVQLPIEIDDYDWKIHKIGKDFYTEKFGDSTFSANKIKEIVTTDHNFSSLFVYTRDDEIIGYCVAVETSSMLHYCYPFYRLDVDTNNLGMGMMLKAILYAVDKEKDYVYLGSVQRETDKYKLQFKGLELWNHEKGMWEAIENK
ncbi:hypothetical protein KC717_05265 [Candidatus Dojkabacteria bacterium]|uniref:N-end rule aminoacyl transferase C-terminal domain-containing protein n=1 Tax=Candidatus Dojkabacteria bacterium TaxID=2099670 RepID=A0A955L8K8_9BACT|nr:hypothetical protein [Candidatus Dojkabacteria bacterium]